MKKTNYVTVKATPASRRRVEQVLCDFCGTVTPGYLRLEYRFAGATNTRAWVFYHSEKLEIVADTPEDAAAKLAIELFKRGILTKEATS